MKEMSYSLKEEVKWVSPLLEGWGFVLMIMGTSTWDMKMMVDFWTSRPIRPVLDVSLLGIYLLFFIIFWSDDH